MDAIRATVSGYRSSTAIPGTTRRICPAAWPTLLITIGLAACVDADNAESRVHVINPANPEQPSCELTFSEDLTIGVADHPATHAIGEIIAWAVGDDGTIYILDFNEPGVRIYSEDGDFRRVVGRRGRGPGEFERPYRIAVRGDKFIVYDHQLSRLAMFDSTGRHISTGTLPFYPESDVNPQLTDDGRVLVSTLANVDGRVAQIHELSNRYELVRSFGEPPIDLEPGDNGLLAWGAIDAGPDGSVWFSPAADYEIRRYDPAGTLRASIRREHDFDFRPRPYIQERELPEGQRAIGFDHNRAISTQLVLDRSGYVWRFIRDNVNDRIVVDAFKEDGSFVFSGSWSTADAPGGMDRRRRFYRISREAGYPQLVRLRANPINEEGDPCVN
jgi:hypothetical protein